MDVITQIKSTLVQQKNKSTRITHKHILEFNLKQKQYNQLTK